MFGTVIGFAVYLVYYRSGKIFRTLVNALMRITENTPVVVILMILYYIVFGSVDVSSVIVSVIGFTLIFAGSVIGVIKVGVGAKPHPDYDLKDWVLSRFPKEEQEAITRAADNACLAAECILTRGIDEAMNRYSNR